jgi:hypothetical protein
VRFIIEGVAVLRVVQGAAGSVIGRAMMLNELRQLAHERYDSMLVKDYPIPFNRKTQMIVPRASLEQHITWMNNISPQSSHGLFFTSTNLDHGNGKFAACRFVA